MIGVCADLDLLAMNGVSAVPVAVPVALVTAGLSKTAIVVFVAVSWTLRSCPHHRLYDDFQSFSVSLIPVFKSFLNRFKPFVFWHINGRIVSGYRWIVVCHTAAIRDTIARSSGRCTIARSSGGTIASTIASAIARRNWGGDAVLIIVIITGRPWCGKNTIHVLRIGGGWCYCCCIRHH